MATVQDALDGLFVTYPRVQPDQALLYFQQIHRRILQHAQLELDEEEIDMVDGTRQYAKNSTDENITSIRAAYYMTSATAVTKLTPVSTDWMDQNITAWRTTTDTSTPDKFYVEAVDSATQATAGKVVVGLDPIPDTTKTAGYPIVKIYGSVYQALLPTDAIPAIIPSIRVYIEGMKSLWAADKDIDRYGAWNQLYEKEINDMMVAINGTIEDLDVPRVVPTWMRNTKVQ